MREFLYPKVLLVLIVALVSISCKSTKSSSAEITVSAAASLKEVFEQLAADFEAAQPDVKVNLNFAGSQSLRMQIEQGARVDVFASANYEHIEALLASENIVSSSHFAANRLVIVTPAGDQRLNYFENLADVERLVLGGPEVPVGRYSDEIIEKADRELSGDFAARVFARVASRENNVRLALAKVVLGEADAALVYRTDAISAGDSIRIVEIPPRFHVMTSYFIGKVAGAPANKHAQDFMDLVLSDEGTKRLVDYGFQSPTALQTKPGAL